MPDQKKSNLYTLKELPQLWDEYSKIYEKLLAAPVFKKIASDLIAAIYPQPGSIVHDGGCGIGFHLKSILDKTQASKIIATDLSTEMLERAKNKLALLSREDQQKIELRELDLSVDWPKEIFNIEVYQLVANYLPGEGWKRIIEKSFESLVDGGYLYSCTLLKGLSVKKLSRNHIFDEIRHTPLSSFPAMLKSTKIMGNFERYAEEGAILLPSKEDYLDYHFQVGFKKVDIVGEIFWGAGIIVRAQKDLTT